MKYTSSIISLLPFIILLSSSFFTITPNFSVTADAANADSDNESYEEVLDDADIVGSALDPHPDPNEENYDGMIYIGRHEEDGKRMGFDKNNGMCDLCVCV